MLAKLKKTWAVEKKVTMRTRKTEDEKGSRKGVTVLHFPFEFLGRCYQ